MDFVELLDLGCKGAIVGVCVRFLFNLNIDLHTAVIMGVLLVWSPVMMPVAPGGATGYLVIVGAVLAALMGGSWLVRHGYLHGLFERHG